MHAFPSSVLGPRSSRPDLVFRLSPPGAAKSDSGLQDADNRWRSLAGCTVNNWNSPTLTASAAARARLAQSNNLRGDENDDAAPDIGEDRVGEASDDASAASAASSEQQEKSATAASGVQQEKPATTADEDAAYKALHRAIVRHCDFRVGELLQASETSQSVLQRKDSDGHTLLHQAVLSSPSRQTATIVSCLQAGGADLEARNILGETPLVLAVRTALDFTTNNEGSFDSLCVVRCLLERGADADVADELTAETPLMEAACRGSREACQLLLSFGADAGKVAEGGKTAVDFALSEGHASLANFLCEAVDGAPKPEEPASEAEAPAAAASCCSGWPRLLQSVSDQLCRFYTNVNSNMKGLWSRQFAALSRDEDLAGTASTNAGNASGEPQIATYQALLEAIQETCDAKVREILKEGDMAAVLNRRDSDGLSLLHQAALAPPSRQAAAIVACLQSCGADVEARNLLGETPLLLAVRAALDCSEETSNSHRFSIAKCLLEAGANANAADELTGETSLTEAACRGSRGLCELLVSFRADVSKATSGGVTPIDFANNEGHEELAKILSELSSHGQKKKAASPAAGTSEPKPTTKKQAGYATDYGFRNWQSAGFTQRTFFAEKEEEQERKANDAGPRGKPGPKSTPSADHWDWCHGAGPGGGFQAGGTYFRPGQMPGAFRPGNVPGSFGNFGASHFGSSRMPFSGGLPGRAGAPTFSSVPGFGYSEPKGFDSAAQRRRRLAGLEQHFHTLGLGMDASNDQIRTAYRKLALQHHPDKNQGSQRAAEKFKKIQVAYEAISERLA